MSLLTPEERIKKARQKAALAIDKSPTSRQQTGSFVAWQQLADVLGQPFDVTNIPLSKLYQMRRDPMIAFSLMYCKVPLVRAPWYIQCSDSQVAAFIDNALRSIYGSLIFQYTNSFDFGYQAIVKRFDLETPDWDYIDKDTNELKKVWDSDKVPALIWKSFVGLAPEQVNPAWSDNGDFIGIQYDNANALNIFPLTKNDSSKMIDLDHALWVTNDKDSVFGSLWGYPRIGHAYRYWWSYWYTWALSDRHYEKDADPPTVVRYPHERVLDDETGEETDTRAIALQIGEDLRSGSTVAMPSDAVQDYDGKSTGKYEWDITHVNTGGNFSAFIDRFQYLDVMKMRSVMVPENALVEGSGGTSSRNVADAMGDIFFESQAVTMSEIDDHINRYMIPQLVERNFPEFNGICKKVTRGFSQSDDALAKQIVQLVGQQDPDKLQVNVREILEQAGVPLLSIKQIEAKQRQIAEDQGKAKPLDVDPSNGNAGVVDGKYVADREKISLSLAEDDTLDADKSEWHHAQATDKRFEDKDIKKSGDDLLGIWKESYQDTYDSFTKLLNDRGKELSLAENDDEEDSKSIANKIESIMKAWAGISFLKRAVDRSKDVQKQVMNYASKKELTKAEIKDVEWDADRKEAEEWIDQRGADLLQNVSDTAKEEVRNWLTNNINSGKSPAELSVQFAKDFENYPSWKAARVVRTETRDAYNAATLLSGKAQGLSHAIASDASGGRNINTDEHCIDRNGKKFTIDKALKERDHPNGTLGWILVPSDVELSDKPVSKLKSFFSINR